MFGANNKRNSRNNNLHLVLICDESGILDSFKIIKDHLGNRSNIILSLIYTFPSNYPNPLFERELSIMEKRFSCNLFSYMLKITPGDFEYLQEIIEAVINSNVISKMQFTVFGNEIFVKYIYEFLQYLNIDRYSIELKMT